MSETERSLATVIPVDLTEGEFVILLSATLQRVSADLLAIVENVECRSDTPECHGLEVGIGDIQAARDTLTRMLSMVGAGE